MFVRSIYYQFNRQIITCRFHSKKRLEKYNQTLEALTNEIGKYKAAIPHTPEPRSKRQRTGNCVSKRPTLTLIAVQKAMNLHAPSCKLQTFSKTILKPTFLLRSHPKTVQHLPLAVQLRREDIRSSNQGVGTNLVCESCARKAQCYQRFNRQEKIESQQRTDAQLWFLLDCYDALKIKHTNK